MSPTTSSSPHAGPRHALVAYESMFGCTEAVATAVASGLAEAGFAVTVRDVRSAWAEPVPPFDLLVVGAPTHAFSLSRPSTRLDAVRQGGRAAAEAVGLREWLDGLSHHEPARGRRCAAFDTRVTRVRRLPKAASTRAAHLLVRQGYRPVARPTAFLVEDLQGPLLDGETERARAWGHEVGTAATLSDAGARAAGRR